MTNYVAGETYLITSSSWFIAQDGHQYRAVWGTVHGIHDSLQVLGIRTNAKSTNWYIHVGNMTIAGCQVHHAIRCREPHLGDIRMLQGNAERPEAVYATRSHIYNANRANT